MDPCELRQSGGDIAVRDLIARRVPLFEFAMRSVIKQYDVATAEGRVSALNQVAPLVGKIRDASLRPEYIRLVAGWLGMEVDIVSTAVKRVAGKSNTPLPDAPAMAVNLSDPLLMLEREVLKAKLQANEIAPQWVDIEANAFSYGPYAAVRAKIDSLPEMSVTSLLERTEDETLRGLITELIVEPIRTDGEVSERYVASIIARLREVALSRDIAEIKSTLQRINPVEEPDRYNEIFGALVAKEAQKRAQKDLAVGDL
jgi:DNA primase